MTGSVRCLTTCLSLFAVIAISSVPSSALAQAFQPAFHQALRWSDSTSGTVTYRLKVPLGRAGNRVRLTFAAGDGPLTLHRVTIARLSGTGVTTATFAGQAVVSVGNRQRVTSDALTFPVTFGEEVYVSFEAQGYLATSSIMAFPGSFAWAGNRAAEFPGPSGGAWYRAIGLATVYVEAPATRAFVALGDSITEGYVSGDVWTYSGRADDYRNAWPAVMQKSSGIPVANAGVSGQGLYDALLNLDREVKSVSGITDCVVLLGTNDLPSSNGAQTITNNLSTLITRLNGFCRVWMSTLLPKEDMGHPNYATIVAQRRDVNAWIRSLTNVAGIIDFEAVTRDGSNVDRFKPGYAADHVHPSITGLSAMGLHAADFFATPALTSIAPASGSELGGTNVTITGVGLRRGLSVRFGGVASRVLNLSPPYAVSVTTPEGVPGTALVEVVNTDGSSGRRNEGFTYTAEPPIVAGCSPLLVPATLGGDVVLSGARFRTGMRVFVGSKEASDVRLDSSAQLRFRSPPGAPGPASVKVLGPSGEAAEAAECFTYAPAPVLTGLTPSEIEAGARASLTLRGNNLSAVESVLVGATRLKPLLVSDTELAVETPPLAEGQFVLKAEALDGQMAVLATRLHVMGRSELPIASEPVPPTNAPTEPPVIEQRRSGCSIAAATPPTLLAIAALAALAFRRRTPTKA